MIQNAIVHLYFAVVDLYPVCNGVLNKFRRITGSFIIASTERAQGSSEFQNLGALTVKGARRVLG